MQWVPLAGQRADHEPPLTNGACEGRESCWIAQQLDRAAMGIAREVAGANLDGVEASLTCPVQRSFERKPTE
jgi:hypothetical protein